MKLKNKGRNNGKLTKRQGEIKHEKRGLYKVKQNEQEEKTYKRMLREWE